MKKVVISLAYNLLLAGARFFKFGFITGTALCGPLIGLSCSLSTIGLSFAILCITSLAKPLILALHLPTLAGAFYLYAFTNNSRSARFLSALVPLLCFILFALHPVGSQALPYTWLWIFPCIITFKNTHTVWLQALGSTLSAHAVGSVIWLYCVGPHSPEAWLALMPLVIVERLCLAAGLTVGICAVKKIQQYQVDQKVYKAV